MSANDPTKFDYWEWRHHEGPETPDEGSCPKCGLPFLAPYHRQACDELQR